MTSLYLRSMAARSDAGAVEGWLAQCATTCRTETQIVPLDQVTGWSTGAGHPTIHHRDGAFFSVVGIEVATAHRRWQQPIIDQPEVGILGMLVQVRDGLLQCLMQAKAEPGTVGGVQLAPTVQATLSNYTGRHGGSAVPYVDAFVGESTSLRGGDVPQSEQGSRFLHKHNRNAVRHVGDEIEQHDGFAWFTLADLHRALRTGDLVNFDARTVLAGLHAQEAARIGEGEGHDDVSRALVRSMRPGSAAVHEFDEIVDWLSRARRDLPEVRRVPLGDLEGWARRDGMLTHESGTYFSVVGARVTAQGREVASWCQPMVVEPGTGLLGLLVSTFDGVVHVLVRTLAEPGLASGAEIAPTVQCTPVTAQGRARVAPSAVLDALLTARPPDVLFDNVLSGEGGRFYRATQRHVVARVAPAPAPPGFRWVAVHQLAELIARGQAVNEQARSLFVCLMSLLTPEPADGPPADR